jgi:hypothetical protein
MDTLENVRITVSRFIGDSGMCPDDERVLKHINEARRFLYPLGDWECLSEAICVCPQNCGITLPAAYDFIRSARMCGQKVVIENHWFTAVSSFEDFCTDTNLHMVKKPGNFVTFCDWPTPEDAPCGCCPEESSEYGFYLSIELEDERDYGVRLTFHGRGANINNLSVTREINEHAFQPSEPQPGEGRFVELKRVAKPKTHGRIRVFGTDGANRIPLAVYEHDDINPRYARYYLPHGVSTGSNIVLNCKKRYAPLDEDSEFVEIHPDALIHVLQGLTERESRNYQAFQASLSMAVAYLNKEQSGPESTSMGAIQMSAAYRVDGLIF